MRESSAALFLEVGQFSHPGQKRKNNEDWLGTFQPEDGRRMAQKGSLFVVADGMGGHRSGETASRQAVDQVIRAYLDDPGDDVALSIQQAIERANSVLHGGGAERPAGNQQRGTTMVAAIVRRDQLWIANVGDSRAYLLHCDSLQQLSRDHSWAAAGAQAGMENGWIGRHLLTRALGTRPRVEVDVFGPLPLESGDRILLCSDGLTGPLPDAAIQEIAGQPRSPQWVCEKLVEAANERGGPDNVSALMVEVKSQDKGSARGAGTGQQARDGAPVLANMRAGLTPGVVVLIVLVLLGLGFLLGLILFNG